jgi:hypothetical protein
MNKKKVVNAMEELISKLEDNGITVNVVEVIEEPVILKLNSEDALKVTVNKLMELAVDKEITISSSSIVSKDNIELQIDKQVIST